MAVLLLELGDDVVLDMGEDFHKGGIGVGAEHGYACLAEIGYALEQGGGCQMSAYVEYAAVLVYAVDALGDLTVDEGEFLGYGRLDRLIADCGGFE